MTQEGTQHMAKLEFLKDIFDAGPLDYAAFVKAVGDKGLNLADLSQGEYVSRSKYDTDVGKYKGQAEDLTAQIAKRDSDLKDLNTALTAAQADASKYAEAQSQLTTLQTTYADEKAAYEQRLKDQDYSFRVKTAAGDLKFSSKAAKNEFIRQAVEKKFKVDGDTLVGYQEFLKQYQTDDPGAFAAPEEPKPDPKTPDIVLPGGTPKPAGNTFLDAFNFASVRKD